MNPDRQHLRPDYLDRVIETLDGAYTRNPSCSGDRDAAVLLPLIDTGEPALLGIIRSDSGIHGGQFGLPGGFMEAHDSEPWETAVREAREELGLEQEVERLGDLGEFNTYVSRMRVKVEVGYVARSQAWVLQEDEVAGVLQVPLALLVRLFQGLPAVDDVLSLPIETGFEFEPEPYLVEGTYPPRGRGHLLETADGPQEMPFIWGLTARILYDFLRHVWIPASS